LGHEFPARVKCHPIVELRQYTLHPGKRDVLIDLFEREFIETQEAVGIQVIGQFHDLDNADRFVWLRGFPDMPARAKSLDAFYNGDVWKKHRDVANATMIDSDNVLLLRVAEHDSGFHLATHEFGGRGVLVAAIFYFASMPNDIEIASVEKRLAFAGVKKIAAFVTERSPNNFPRLPVRENENVYICFHHFPNPEQSLQQSELWKLQLLSDFSERDRLPEVIRLKPTPRSVAPGVY